MTPPIKVKAIKVNFDQGLFLVDDDIVACYNRHDEEIYVLQYYHDTSFFNFEYPQEFKLFKIVKVDGASFTIS